MQRLHLVACLVIATSTLVNFSFAAEPQQTQQDEKPQQEQAKATDQLESEVVERARETVRLLDNVYKQVIVLITDKYVHEPDDFPAGSAAVELFRMIAEGGSHNVQLLDATGEPYDPENVADDAFEREGIRRLKAGADFYDEVVMNNGEPRLRAITPVPVVMQKCIMCHSHYEDARPGEPIGAISYDLPIK